MLPAVALVSAGALAYEVLLTRLFSIVQWHHSARRMPPLMPEERHCPTNRRLDRVFCGLHRPRPDDLSGRSRLEHGRLFRKRIDALPFFGGGFPDDREFRKTK